MRLRSGSIFLLGALALVVGVGLTRITQSGLSTAQAQSTGSSAIQARADVLITIKTHFTSKAGLNTADSSSWPKLALFLNNGTNYDGPYDYGNCKTAGSGCGTPNLYMDKLQPGNCGNYFCPAAETQVIETKVTVGKLVTQPNPSNSSFLVTKLSYVFFNDYWNPATTPVTDRDAGITKIEFFGPTGALLDTLTPSSPTFGVESADTPEINGVYFDYGLVNAEGVQDSEQNGMVGAFDKEAADETIAQNQSRQKGMWSLAKEGSFNIISTSVAKNIIEKITVTTPPPTTPGTTPIKPAPTSGILLPWSENTQQQQLGPTAAWTNAATHTGSICNGTWCWNLNFTTNTLENNGNPVDITTGFGAGLQASAWSNGGPTAGWEDYKHGLISLANQKYLWLWGTGGWANNGQATDLTTQQYWKDTVAATDGTALLSGKGISAAWTDIPNSREYFCNGKWCWVFNYEELRWHNQDDAGKGRPFDISSLFKIAPNSKGVTITSSGGPGAAWTNDVAKKSTICNQGYCWSYTHRAGSRPDLLDVSWDRPNAQELGQPVTVCESFGVSAETCATEPSETTTPPKIIPELSACSSTTNPQITFTWNEYDVAKKYILRIDQYNLCKNEKNETITWFCGPDQGFPDITGDQYYLLNATGADSVCTNGICRVTKPVLANATYTNASIQWVLADNNTDADSNRMGFSASFSCPGTNAAPLIGDLNKNETVDIFDYNLLLEKWGSDFCEFNLAGSSCMIDAQDISVIQTNFGLSRLYAP